MFASVFWGCYSKMLWMEWLKNNRSLFLKDPEAGKTETSTS